MTDPISSRNSCCAASAAERVCAELAIERFLTLDEVRDSGFTISLALRRGQPLIGRTFVHGVQRRLGELQIVLEARE